jgi:hypothetical protein
MKAYSERNCKERGLFTWVLPRVLAVMFAAGLIVYLLIMLGQALNVSL